jgi:alpha-1,3-rhamnosyl/mannosyltransferase
MALYYRQVGQRVARSARAILTPSFTARDCIVRDLGIAPKQVTVVYNAPRREYAPADPAATKAFLERHGLRPGYVLGLGSFDPRKNLSGLADAHAELPDTMRDDHPLVIAGSMPPPRVQQRVAHRARLLGPLQNEDMAPLYSAAAVFVFPSHDEGFGLPLLEAMACGTPVVATRCSSIPEIVADAALLADPGTGHALAASIAQVLSDPQRRADLTRRGYERAQEFSWERCARETLTVYRRAGAAS